MLRVLVEGGLTHMQMLIAFFRTEAYGGLDDYLEKVTADWGAGKADAIRAEMRAMGERYTDDLRLDWERAQREALHVYGPIGLLNEMPEADFLALVQGSVGHMPDPFKKTSAPAALTEICRRRGIPFRMIGVGSLTEFEWTGDAATDENVLQPAASALDDARLEGPRQDFEDARDALRERTPRGRRRAVAEACNAVESGLKVLLRHHGCALPAAENVDALLKACRDANLFPQAVDGKGVPIEQILAGPARFGNRRGRHGSEVPHDVDPDEAEAVIGAAAVALTFIARRLPPS